MSTEFIKKIEGRILHFPKFDVIVTDLDFDDNYIRFYSGQKVNFKNRNFNVIGVESMLCSTGDVIALRVDK